MLDCNEKVVKILWWGTHKLNVNMIYPAQLSLGTITRFLNNISLIFVSIFLKLYWTSIMSEVISTLSLTSLPNGIPGFFIQENFTHVCAPENTNVLFKLLHESARVFELTWKRSPRKNELIPSPERLVVKHSAFYTELEIYLPGCHPSFWDSALQLKLKGQISHVEANKFVIWTRHCNI